MDVKGERGNFAVAIDFSGVKKMPDRSTSHLFLSGFSIWDVNLMSYIAAISHRSANGSLALLSL